MLAFVSPGLTRKEKRVVYTALPFVGILAIWAVPMAFRRRASGFVLPQPFHVELFQWQPDAATSSRST